MHPWIEATKKATGAPHIKLTPSFPLGPTSPDVASPARAVGLGHPEAKFGRARSLPFLDCWLLSHCFIGCCRAFETRLVAANFTKASIVSDTIDADENMNLSAEP